MSHKELEALAGNFSTENMSIEQRNELRDKIAGFEKKLFELKGQIEIPIEHHFGKGVYAREMKMPAGSVLVGKIHKFENINILSAGEVSILSQDGGMLQVKAPFTLVAKAGAKRVFYAHSDVVWTVMHGTNETDLEKIENEFIAKNYNEITGG